MLQRFIKMGKACYLYPK